MGALTNGRNEEPNCDRLVPECYLEKREVPPSLFGENLTLVGMLEQQLQKTIDERCHCSLPDKDSYEQHLPAGNAPAVLEQA